MTNKSRMTKMLGQKEEPIVRFRRVVIFTLLLLSCSSAMWYWTARTAYTKGHYFVMDSLEEDIFGYLTIVSKGEAKYMGPWQLGGWIKVGDSVSKAPCDDWLYLYRRDSITGEYKLHKKLGITHVTFPKSWFCE